MKNVIFIAAILFAFSFWGHAEPSTKIVFLDSKNGVEVGYSKNPESSNRHIQIEMRKNGKQIQTIDYQYPDEFFDDATEKIERHVEFVDLNFDGFKDVRIFLGQYGNQDVAYWQFFIWNAKNSSFEFCDSQKIPNPEPNPKEKCITSFIREHAAYHHYYIYRFDGGKLKLASHLHEVTSLDLAKIYGNKIPEDEDAGEFMLKTFDLPLSLYDSVLYVEEQFSGKNRMISKPSLMPSRQFCNAFGWDEAR